MRWALAWRLLWFRGGGERRGGIKLVEFASDSSFRDGEHVT